MTNPTTDLNWRQLSSSWLSAMRYDPDTQTLQIRFSDGHQQEYNDVPQAIADGLEGAPSAGKYFHANIKDQF